MEEDSVKRLGLILAIQAEVEGMKSDNENRKQYDESMAYTYSDFQSKAEEIRIVVYSPPECLQNI